MDAGGLRVFDRLPGLIHVVGVGPCQGSDDGALNFFGDVAHRLKVSRGAGSEARLDNVYLQPLELLGNLHFLVPRHANAGGLFSIPERGVQKQYFVASHIL